MEEHAHIYQWNGYYFTMKEGEAFLLWKCQVCGKKKEEEVVMTDWWYKQAYAIWDYEQHHKGCFDVSGA